MNDIGKATPRGTKGEHLQHPVWLNQNRGVMTGPVLIPGCGTGHDVRAIASAEPASFPLGIDISEIAVRRCRQQKTCGNEGYRKANLFALPEDLMGTFNWVVEHLAFVQLILRNGMRMYLL